jgi:hypothetical protein
LPVWAAAAPTCSACAERRRSCRACAEAARVAADRLGVAASSGVRVRQTCSEEEVLALMVRMLALRAINRRPGQSCRIGSLMALLYADRRAFHSGRPSLAVGSHLRMCV